ncbi:MAG: indole-3-glycerol phosphate synthase TrpC [Planctomycetota bacterium]
MSTILASIVETKRVEVAAARRDRPVEEVEAAARAAPAPRDFYAAVTAPTGPIGLIAEIKKASPSAGLIRRDFDPVVIARIYERSGAAALSVLTDETYFSGRLAYVQTVKDVVSLPILRKDFIVDSYQVFESRAAGADAILLITEVLSVETIASFISIAGELGMAALLEVHDAEQLENVRGLISAHRRVILGINNRDLHRQRTDLRTTEDLAPRLSSGTPFVAESGIKTRSDVLRLQRAGATALLIGETFMRAADIGAKVRELMGT